MSERPTPSIVNGYPVHSHVGEWCPMCLAEGERVALAASPDSPTLDERDPLVAVPRSLLLGAVDLWSNVHNALVWVPTEKNPRNGWGYFWARMHRLREAFNRPDHEQLRRVYEGSFGRGITENEPLTIDPNWDPAAEAPERPA